MGIKIEAFTKEKLTDIIPLVNNYKYKSFYNYPYLANEQLVKYAIEEISEVLSYPQNNLAFIAKQGRKIAGLAIVQKLPWDSEYFGIKMANVSYLIAEGLYRHSFDIKKELLNAVFISSAKEKIKFISAKISFDDSSSVHSCEETGFRMMSMCATYLVEKKYYSSKSVGVAQYDCSIRPYQSEDYRDLKDIFSNSCIKSHFRMDHKIPQDKAANLYSEWIKNSCNGFCDETLVIQSKNQIIGCATFNLEKRFSAIASRKLGRTPLVVFSESARGTGLHNLYILSSLLGYYFKKVDMVDVIIQMDNIKAAKYWFQLGAKMLDCKYVLHKWLL